MTTEDVLTVENLTKQYRGDLGKRWTTAVEGASFSVKRGEIFGFIGPNGAGKTTTIRTLMGLIRPTAGRCTIFGDVVPSRAARRRVGFLPEAAYFYDYLTPRELLDLTGRLFGLDRATRKKRAGELIERVGLASAADRPLKKFSKGMLTRAGLAQALVNEPELVVLDEPMSGLDPTGRKEVRDLIQDLRDRGATIFFSTHILPDVEALCDRVAIIARGKIQDVGAVSTLLAGSLVGTDVVVRSTEPIEMEGATVRRVEDVVTVSLGPTADVNAAVVALAAKGALVSVTPRRESLEDLFLRKTRS
jgi:ABC-2 type transport system ATP-binding protein